MHLGQVFVYGLSALQSCASVGYTVGGDYRRAIFWACLAVANYAFAGVK